MKTIFVTGLAIMFSLIPIQTDAAKGGGHQNGGNGGGKGGFGEEGNGCVLFVNAEVWGTIHDDGDDPSYFGDVLGTTIFEYEFTDMGIYTRLASGGPGGKKRCQEQLPLPAGVVHPKLLITPVSE